MSISSINNTIDRLEREIASLEKQKSNETDKEIRVSKSIDNLTNQANKTTSPTGLRSKLNQIRTKQTELSRIEKKKVDISKRIADKNKQLRKYNSDLVKEQERERKRIENEQMNFQRTISSEIQKQKRLVAESAQQEAIKDESPSSGTKIEYDVFISHAWEDKESFVRPFAIELQNLGIKVWYDEFKLEMGDSLRRSVDSGLTNSRYGIVVLSNNFFNKNWPQYELDGLVNREMAGKKIILPIWHKVSKDDVQQYSPSLADKVALNTAMYSTKEIADEIKKLVDK